MPRFASKYRRYRITAREHVKMTLANGRENIIQHGVICAFEHGGLVDWEKQQCRDRFKFRGTTQEMDEVTQVDPGGRLSLYDTDAPFVVGQWAQWDEREENAPGTIKREVEEFLLGYRTFGIDYLLLEPQKLPAPWPAYDELVVRSGFGYADIAKRNLETARATGVPLEDLIEYERASRNSDRLLVLYEEELAKRPVEEPPAEIVLVDA